MAFVLGLLSKSATIWIRMAGSEHQRHQEWGSGATLNPAMPHFLPRYCCF